MEWLKKRRSMCRIYPASPRFMKAAPGCGWAWFHQLDSPRGWPQAWTEYTTPEPKVTPFFLTPHPSKPTWAHGPLVRKGWLAEWDPRTATWGLCQRKRRAEVMIHQMGWWRRWLFLTPIIVVFSQVCWNYISCHIDLFCIHQRRLRFLNY